MKSKSFVIILITCCVVALVALYTHRKNQKDHRESRLGLKLFDSLPVNQIGAIAISSRDGAVHLKKGPAVWVVENRFGYPADFALLSDLVKSLRNVKIGRSFTATQDTITRLSLVSPDAKEAPDEQKGIRIVLADSLDKTLLDLILGKTRNGSARSGGQYFMVAGDETVYLADTDFDFLETRASDWIQKDLLQVQADKLEKVVCLNAEDDKVIYTLKRPQKDKKPELLNYPKGRKIIPSKIDRVFGALSSLRIEDVADPAQSAGDKHFADMPRFEYHLYDGSIYTLYPGKALADNTEQFYFKADAGFLEAHRGSESVKEAAEPDKEGSTKPAKQPAQSTEELHNKLHPWTFIISSWQHENFITDPQEFLEQPQ